MGFRKLEQFGPYRLIRAASPVNWAPGPGNPEWDRAAAVFFREGGVEESC